MEVTDEIQSLVDKLTRVKAELSSTKLTLSRVERLNEEANCCIEDLKDQVITLKGEPHKCKSEKTTEEGKKELCDVAVQTDKLLASELVSPRTGGNEELPMHALSTSVSATASEISKSTDIQDAAWLSSHGENQVSIAESLKSAAEDAMHQTGYVYDENYGLYYDFNTGYYYDSERCLHYNSTTGVYYRFDEQSQNYEFHSQIAVQQPSYDQSQYHQGAAADPTRKDEDNTRKTKTAKKKRHKKKGTDSESEDEKTERRHRKHQSKSIRRSKDSENNNLEKHKHKHKKHSKRKSEHHHKKSHKRDRRKSKGGTRADVEDGHRSDSGCRKKVSSSDPCLAELQQPIDNESSRAFNAANGEGGLLTVNKARRTKKPKVVRVKTHVSGDDESMEYDSDQGSVEGSTREEGECEESSASSTSNSDGRDVIETTATEPILQEEENELTSQWPPCIRAIVQASEHVDRGSLFVVTCMGAKIGREKNNSLCIPDVEVSKVHAEVLYDEAMCQYTVTDCGSQNGTFLNDQRLSEAKCVSEAYLLSHGDVLRMGVETWLLFHIHEGTDTCDECEPGQVQAALAQQQIQPKTEHVVLSKAEKEALRRKQLKQIKKRYGLEASAYVDNKAAIDNANYMDRSTVRRKTVGSDDPYQKEEAPASVNRAISSENPGFKMLKKMGWSEGQSLGKNMTGITEPVNVEVRSQKAGLGSKTSVRMSMDNVQSRRQAEVWARARERFEKLQGNDEDESGTPSQPPEGAVGQQVNVPPRRVATGRAMTFVQGATEHADGAEQGGVFHQDPILPMQSTVSADGETVTVKTEPMGDG
ncbi:PREDICTED: angiogenic factor with G patch and FHA domains 1-like [Priapulus caudatus]|uniref:Angiogenic factor with G patch and FHA domains 1-like n=1 Tax=Priapulus caudatus TaxID=37621 RepID=A0ABM1E9Z7_PRICU|nr:PREDICTED: angiogenic factor with G patch and FHA domains 1-like [Priapulus caudatus]